MFLEKTPKQNIQYINAEATFSALEQATKNAKPFVGSMFWREISGQKYLMRWTPPDTQKSLGPLSDTNANAVDKFRKGKEEAESRVKSLTQELDLHRKLNKALRVGRMPDVVVSALNAIRAAGLEDHFLVVGTHAIYAYETAAGVLFPSDGLATEDVDFLLDTRKQVKFVTQIKKLGTSFLEVLQKADKSFQMMGGQLYTAINDKGFQVDVVRRVAGDADPHPMRLSEKEDDFWAVQIPTGGKLLGARPFKQVVVSQNGSMARMTTIHPLDFARIKQALGASRRRDPLKAGKDLLQARLVTEMVHEYLTNLAQEDAMDSLAVQYRDVFAKAVCQDQQPAAAVLEAIKSHSTDAMTTEQIAAVDAFGASRKVKRPRP